MNELITRERLIREVKRREVHDRFQVEMQTAATREPTYSEPVDDVHDRLMRVLIVDDHRASADTLSTLVDKWGHDVRRAYDGVTGLSLAAAYQPDVLLLDMLMSGVDGFEVAAQVRRQDRLKQCFIIAITGRTDPPHRRRCYEAGVDLFLIKPVAPIHMQTLLDLEAKLVRRSNSNRSYSTTGGEHVATY
jgi:CheY-like chemotaxis protein